MTETPRFEGLWPGMAEWWIANLARPPLVVVRCGRGEPKCTKAIGEVKTDGEHTLAMSKNEHPEPVVEWSPLAALTVEELEADIAERESKVLRHIGTGPDRKMVFKRPDLPRAVAPIGQMGFFTCQVHGEITIDREHLYAFVRDTQKPKRTYWAQPDLD